MSLVTRFTSMVLKAFWVGDTMSAPLPPFTQMAACSIVCTVLSVLGPGDLTDASERVLILSFKVQINLSSGIMIVKPIPYRWALTFVIVK